MLGLHDRQLLSFSSMLCSLFRSRRLRGKPDGLLPRLPWKASPRCYKSRKNNGRQPSRNLREEVTGERLLCKRSLTSQIRSATFRLLVQLSSCAQLPILCLHNSPASSHPLSHRKRSSRTQSITSLGNDNTGELKRRTAQLNFDDLAYTVECLLSKGQHFPLKIELDTSSRLN